MARPPLPIGTYGQVNTVKLGERKFRARAKYRDYDGVTRPVERVGKSRAEAENRLKIALRERARMSRDGDVTPETKLSDVARLWLRDIRESNKAIRTKGTYNEVWDNLLADAVGSLRVADVRVSTVDKVVRAIQERHGPSRAKHARTVLSGIFGLAVRHDALDGNPIRDLAPVTRNKRRERKIVLTEQTVSTLRQYMHSSAAAKKYDLVDVVDVLSGVGCRIGELLALDWSTKVNLDSGSIRIEGTVVRVPGAGLIAQPDTKTSAGMRTIYPPDWVMDILRARHARAECDWVFPTSVRTLNDPDNVRARLRQVVAKTAWEGLHPHAFRHFVATRLDAAGWTARQIADYLGHDRVSMTQDEYMDRHVAGQGSSQALPEIPFETSG